MRRADRTRRNCRPQATRRPPPQGHRPARGRCCDGCSRGRRPASARRIQPCSRRGTRELPPKPAVRVLSNRGVAGIDGTVSAAVGAALAYDGGRTVALMGDLTFLHDASGLLIGTGEPRPSDLTIVVANDDGGGIFELLEQGDPQYAGVFERVFGTPHGMDLAALCAAYRVPHAAVTVDAWQRRWRNRPTAFVCSRSRRIAVGCANSTLPCGHSCDANGSASSPHRRTGGCGRHFRARGDPGSRCLAQRSDHRIEHGDRNCRGALGRLATFGDQLRDTGRRQPQP